ncbi:MAG: hypothetical protein R2682_13420 [Pyrinomonadaceae bacterium]
MACGNSKRSSLRANRYTARAVLFPQRSQRISHGKDLFAAIKEAKAFVTGAIRNAVMVGRGNRPVNI